MQYLNKSPFVVSFHDHEQPLEEGGDNSIFYRFSGVAFYGKDNSILKGKRDVSIPVLYEARAIITSFFNIEKTNFLSLKFH